MTITVKYDQDAKPGEGTYSKLDTNRDYEARISDHSLGETSRQAIPYVQWKVEVNTAANGDEPRWRKLPQSALRTQLTGGGRKLFFRLAAAVGLVPPGYDGIGEEFTAEETDFYGTIFLARIKYNGEFPEIAFVRPKGEEQIDLPM